MNYYIKLINDSINYIEDNITKEICLASVSKKFHLSQYHFDRLFSITAGVSFKQYVMGRKLSAAAEQLINSDKQIIDIAFQFGFKYPEVFSKSFKKQFGISPMGYRKEKNVIKKVEKAQIIPRNLINYNGKLILKPSYIELNEIRLLGKSQVMDVFEEGFEKQAYNFAKDFLSMTKNSAYLNQNRFYNLICCNGEGSSTYTSYFGKEIIEKADSLELNERIIPKSLYAQFIYKGKMSEIRKTFDNDLFRWIAVKEIKLNPIGIGMITIYEKEYYENQEIKILIPVCSTEK